MLSGRRKLLLADDSPTIRKVVSLTFGDEGLEVVAVGDGDEALRALEDDPPPDILLADVVMPGPDGYELCERVKRDGRLRHVPVILLVGAFEPFNEAEARRVGADTFLTKPFQSIRDLVSKVGSLLGGGEPRAEVEAARAHEEPAPRDERDAAPPAARADAILREDAPDSAAFVAPQDERVQDAASSFADFGADDELIEARPADAFGAASAASGFQPRAESAPAMAEARDPDFPARRRSDVEVVDAEPPDPDVVDVGAFAGWDEERETSKAEASRTEQVEESAMQETTSPQTSHDARHASAATADDTLLDLGQMDAPAAAPPAEDDDDFILDLGDEEHAEYAAADILEEPAYEAAPAWADAPSAFAEAAHGEPARHFVDATAEPASSFEMSASSFEASAPAAVEDAPWRDVVMQDGPQGFAFGGEEPQAMSAALRGFVEPEVVPAAEPVPAVVEDEFTDGSVEGDAPKAPAPETLNVAAHTPQEPSAAGFAVGEARAGVEESLRADQLSREAVETIARRVVEMMSDKVVREIAWEVVPELAELLIKQRLEEGKLKSS